MFQVTVPKNELIEKISANREEHRAVFESAIEGYRTFVMERLEARIVRLKEGKTIEETLYYAIPVDHTDDYTRVIDMLNMDTSDVITLDENMYRCYVDNEWSWARQFAASNSGYTVLRDTSYGKFL